MDKKKIHVQYSVLRGIREYLVEGEEFSGLKAENTLFALASKIGPDSLQRKVQ
jgi:hypothetical protein